MIASRFTPSPPRLFRKVSGFIQHYPPSWRKIQRQLPTVRELLRRLAILPRHGQSAPIPVTQPFLALYPGASRDFDLIGVYRHHEPHAILFREGLPADRIHVLCSGRVKVTSSSSSGRLFLLRVAVPGDILGLAALEEQTTHRVTAEAVSPCATKSIPRADFIRVMKTNPDLSLIAALAIAREYRSAFLSARRLALNTSAAGKLASTLLDLARPDDASYYPTPANLPISFLMQLSQEELGSMAGLSRETVSRLLTRFRREGLVDQSQDRMTLNNPSRLEAHYG
jgi:CRP/FNR family transcriptional regulator, cyclic AMP receptor protein